MPHLGCFNESPREITSTFRIRFYQGVPILMYNSVYLGSVCVFNPNSEQWGIKVYYLDCMPSLFDPSTLPPVYVACFQPESQTH